MLYPKEDDTTNTLMFACRTCHFAEPAGTACIYRNSLKETIAETPGNVQDVAEDPTVGDSSGHVASLSTSTSTVDLGHDQQLQVDETQGLEVVPEMCTLCGQEILCPFCEEPTDRGVMLETTDPEAQARRMGRDAEELELKERTLSGAGTGSLSS